MRRLRSMIATAIVLSAPTAGVAAEASSSLDAVKAGNISVLQASLQQRKDVNQPSPDGTTLLHWAVHQERADIVEALISAGADVNTKNRYGATPLLLAAITGNASITAALL